MIDPPGSRRARDRWRIARWSVGLALLLTPLLMMQLSREWHWKAGSFMVAGLMIGGVLLLYERSARAAPAFRAGVAIALLTAFLTLWTSVVRDDGTGLDVLMVVMAAAVGSFAAWFRPAGMARAMAGVALMHGACAIATATAPSVAATPDGAFRSLAFGGFFAALWLVSAAFFHAASRHDRSTVAQSLGRES